ncbi:MAG: formate dehydrogenase subunit delta [Rhodobacterales bacterium]|nr:formate dehydrogenase subunit delta [Rhodobacterales bacterium]
MQPDKLISMANQIAIYFKTQPGTNQAVHVADHINDFWEPSMRARLAAHAAEGGAGLSPLALEAAEFLRIPAQ